MRSTRLHHIDALRGSVMLLLIPYHGLAFLAAKEADFTGLDFSLFWLHLWRMELFFAVSGFLTAMTLSLWGPKVQIRKRLLRLGVPLAVGMVTIVPAFRLVWLWFGNQKYPNSDSPLLEWTAGNIFVSAPMHLWFLSYLLILNLAALLVWLAVRQSPPLRTGLDRTFRWLMSRRLLVPALAAVCALILSAGGLITVPGEIASSLLPHPVAFSYYAVFFFFGWMLFRNAELLPRIEGKPLIKFGLGTGMAVLAWMLLQGKISLPGFLPYDLVVATTATLATWFTLFGVWGFFALVLAEARPWVRYLADSSYWVYLIHFVFLGAIERALAMTGLHPLPRLVIAVAGALALSLLTYGLLIRYGPIGRLLHGKRERKPESRAARGQESMI